MPLSYRPLALLLAVATSGIALADSLPKDPHAWLDKMASAVQTLSYEGTVVRISDGKAESLKVAHTISDGVIHERVVAQEGDGLEIVRKGNEVFCILPDRRTVRVETWNDQSTLFSTLPKSDLRFGNEYDLVLKRKARVAGRKALEIAIQPHDNFRYGHRLWLDTETGFLLRTQVIGDDGTPLEEVKFVEINLNARLPSQSLETTYEIDSFKWLTENDRPLRKSVDTDWIAEDLPMGFRVTSTAEETMEESGKTVTHIMYSDGLANVSAFIVETSDTADDKHEGFGMSHSYTAVRDGYRVTVVGEVPAATVQRIALSLRRK